ncbi:hypothetical protein [Photobacterium sp. J15]|uniref:hypothetical protein n=1 Tax=Photobacterium sp. J15 TaxID=265901 RepID=UPI000A589ACA|nr:hypothetical protein [Photobacterium sp. J15]
MLKWALLVCVFFALGYKAIKHHYIDYSLSLNTDLPEGVVTSSIDDHDESHRHNWCADVHRRAVVAMNQP